MDDLKALVSDNYIQYASYVILERAIPDAIDGLKPVQRRILHALSKMHDGRFHKVANIVGQTMAYHPHGDAAITEALVNIANKGYLLDRQGNFGNLHTGDPAAAARYIEARLSPMGAETLFHKELTEWTPSYDGRSQEPMRLPARLPLLLLHGAEGIAVGMSTRIFPHNFNELLKAQVRYLSGKSFQLYPDFPSGGYVDVSEYDDGRGRLRMRAIIEIVDDKTLKISQICYSTTTESLIQSITDAAKKGKIKIDSIHDYTAEDVNIEIKLPRGQHAEQVKKALYAFSLCEVSLTAIPTVIHQGRPTLASVMDLVCWHADYLKDLLRRELELELSRLEHEHHRRTLEQIFIENRLYRNLEKVTAASKLQTQVEGDLKPFHHLLDHPPSEADIHHLLGLPMRRISTYDRSVSERALKENEENIAVVHERLNHLIAYTIETLDAMIKAYGKDFKRRSELREFKRVDFKVLDQRKVKVGLDMQGGFLGHKVQGSLQFDAKPHDKLVVFYDHGLFKILPVDEKLYVQESGAHLLDAHVIDPSRIYHVGYFHAEREGAYIKRFVIDKYTLGKTYSYLASDEKLKAFAHEIGGADSYEGSRARLRLAKTPRLSAETQWIDLSQIPLKGYKVRGQRVATRKVTDIKFDIKAPS